MRSRPNRRIWQGWVTFVFWGIAGLTPAQETSMQRWTSTRLPLANMPAAVREKVRYVADHPTLYAQGSNETFLCNPAVYNWFLDHPDRAAAACASWEPRWWTSSIGAMAIWAGPTDREAISTGTRFRKAMTCGCGTPTGRSSRGPCWPRSLSRQWWSWDIPPARTPMAGASYGTRPT